MRVTRGRFMAVLCLAAVTGGCFAIDWNYQLPPTPPPECGNGVQEEGEECDDGNLTLGDDCSPACRSLRCPSEAIPLEPDKPIVIDDSLVGRLDDFAMSCQPSRRPDTVVAVRPSVTGTLSVTLRGRSARTLSVRTACDPRYEDPPVESICLNAEPGAELLWSFWANAGVTYYLVIDGEADDVSLSVSLTECGNERPEGLEQCDDLFGEGCSGCVLCFGDGEFWGAGYQNCYRLGPPVAGWAAARKECLAWGGDLAGLSTVEEMQRVLDANPDLDHAYVGGVALSPACSFAWVDGEPWDTAVWQGGEPDNNDEAGGDEHCTMLGRDGVYDIGCDSTERYLCERASSHSCGNGALDPGEECDPAASSSPLCQGCIVQCAEGQLKDPVLHHCYRLVSERLESWDTAKEVCGSYGGSLASITSRAEQELLRGFLPDLAWIGGHRGDDGSWTWANGEPFCHEEWLESQPDLPDERCIQVSADGWNSAPCDARLPFLCEGKP